MSSLETTSPATVHLPSGWGTAALNRLGAADPASVQLQTLHRGPLCKVIRWRCMFDDPVLREERYSDAFSLNLITSGALVHRDSNHESLLHPGSVVFLCPRTPYNTTHPFGIGDRGCRILFRKDVAIEALERLRPHLAETAHAERPAGLVGSSTAPRAFLRQVVLMIRGRDGTEIEPLLFEETALGLLGETLRDRHGRTDAAGPARSDTTERHRHWVETTKAVLMTRHADNLTLGEIARLVHCSPFHLSRIFKAFTGVSLHRYLIRLRLAIGVERLVQGERDLARLALDLGFSSHSHYTSVFRREFGVAPRDARALGGPDRLV